MFYNISYKTLTEKLIDIRFDKVNGFIRVYDSARYLTLFKLGKYCAIFNRIRYLIRVKSGITYVIYHNYERSKVGSCDSWTLEKTLTFHNVTILIK